VQNVALHKTVTASVKPFTGELNQLTDGKKEAFDYDTVEMKKGSQWIQVDLGEEFSIYAIVMWHDHRYIQVMHDVIVQVSDDPEFKNGVITLFNNDVDNSSGLGVGMDREYFETHVGRIVDGKGTKGRYVRAYTKGGSLSALNCWQEIEVYALPASPKPKSAMTPPITTPTTATIAGPQPLIAPPQSVPALASTPVESTPAETQAPQTVAQVGAAAVVTISATAPTPSQAPVVVPSATGFNRTAVLLAGIGLLVVALGAIFTLTRHSHVAPLAKAK
jgi:hypothetical protein